MTLSPEEAAWLYFRFQQHDKKMPSPRTFQPYYNASSWDLDDLFTTFRDDALDTLHTTAKAVLVVTQGKAWPRMTTKEAFWMRERWQMAERYCRQLVTTKYALGPVPNTPPVDVPAALEWLLTDLWAEQLVDVWLRENARSYVSVEDYSLQESITELEIYLRKLERP
jgi:hypothetical protein